MARTFGLDLDEMYRRRRRCCFRRCNIVWYSSLALIAIYCFIKVLIEKPTLSDDRDSPQIPEDTPMDFLQVRRSFLGIPYSHSNISEKETNWLVEKSQEYKFKLSLVNSSAKRYLDSSVNGYSNSSQISVPECQRKSDLVYIKTHKTGSCTTTNLIYRAALKYDLPTLQFTQFPYPFYGIEQSSLHNLRFLESKGRKLRRRFHIAADHMLYNREDLDKVMEGTPLYTTTLRYPPDQLRSMFSYFDLPSKLGIPTGIVANSDPVEHYILNKKKYPQLKPPYRVDNRNAHILGFNRSLANNKTEVDRFLKRIEREFGLVMITEYSDESNILLRRKMCWEMVDILYISINVRRYKNRQTGLKPDLLELHRNWSHVDYILYEHFNQSLWRQIENEGDSFKQELALYRKYVKLTHAYCAPMYELLRKNKTRIHWLYRRVKPLRFSKTVFHGEFSINAVFCTLARVDIAQFYNIMRVHTHPQICDFIDHRFRNADVNKFKVYRASKSIEMNRLYCAPNPEGTLVALDAIRTGLYL